MNPPVRTIFSVIGLSLLIAGFFWFRPASSSVEKPRVTLLGSSGSSGGLNYSAGTLVLDRPNPGIYFGTVRTPSDREERFSYLIIFRYSLSGNEALDVAAHSGGVTDGKTIETSDTLKIGGKRARVSYRLSLDEVRTGAEGEHMQIVGKDWDLAAGRVFLIDFTEETPVVRQKNVSLPNLPAPLTSTQGAERLAQALKEELGRNDAEIGSFLGLD